MLFHQGRYRINNGNSSLHFVFLDLLLTHFVEEFIEVGVSLLVVDLALFGLYNVALPWTCYISEGVFIISL